MHTVKINQDPNPTVVDLITGTKYRLLSYSEHRDLPTIDSLEVAPWFVSPVNVTISMMRHDQLDFTVNYVKQDKPKFKIILPEGDLLL